MYPNYLLDIAIMFAVRGSLGVLQVNFINIMSFMEAIKTRVMTLMTARKPRQKDVLARNTTLVCRRGINRSR